MNLYETIGGRPTLERVHRAFYDKLIQYPGLRFFFAGIDQGHIEEQQTRFMAAAMGGPREYDGLSPGEAHGHMFLTDAHFDLRQGVLRECILEDGVPPEAAEAWLEIDSSFRALIVKESPEECRQRSPGQKILNFGKLDLYLT